MSQARRNWTYLIVMSVAAALLCSLLVAAWWVYPRYSQQRAPLPPVPDAPIVFQTLIHTDDALPNAYVLGFVDAAGEHVQSYVIPFERRWAPLYPIQTSDGQLTVARSYSGAAGLRGVARSGEFLIYPLDMDSPFRRARDVAPVANTHQIVAINQDSWRGNLQETYSIRLLDLDSRTQVRVLVVLEPDYTQEVPHFLPSLGTAPLHGTQLTYARCRDPECQLVVHDTLTGAEEILVTRDDNILEAPAFSPDGQWIAYTARDGIYVVGAAPRVSSTPRRVIRHEVDEWTWSEGPVNLIPRAAWSPDGSWLLYHRCMRQCAEGLFKLENFTIRKINVLTGEEVFLVASGLYPYWRR